MKDVKALKARFEQGEDIDLNEVDTSTVAGLLKAYFRESRDGVLSSTSIKRAVVECYRTILILF